MNEPFKILKVLIVDDAAAVRQIIRSELSNMRFNQKNVYLANDGQQALETLKSIQFKLVISDLNMPKLNGMELLKAVRILGILDVIFLMVISEPDETKKI